MTAITKSGNITCHFSHSYLPRGVLGFGSSLRSWKSWGQNQIPLPVLTRITKISLQSISYNPFDQALQNDFRQNAQPLWTSVSSPALEVNTPGPSDSQVCCVDQVRPTTLTAD